MTARAHKTFRKIHRWIALTISLFLLVWLVSGIFKTIPFEFFLNLKNRLVEAPAPAPAEPVVVASTGPVAKAKLGYRNIAVTIPDAITALEQKLGRAVEVERISVMDFQNKPAYDFVLVDGAEYLVDALTGAPIDITEAMIEETARAAAPGGSSIIELARIDVHDYYYWGRLPAYKVRFDNRSRTVMYIAAATGQIEQTTTIFSRVHSRILGLHEFDFLAYLWDSDTFRQGFMVAAALAAIFVAGTGLFIAVPARWLAVRRQHRDRQ